MKTKEIDCEILCSKYKTIDSKNIMVIFNEEELTDFKEDSDNKYKAKLIIEIPEQKIEITENQLDEVLFGLKLMDSRAHDMEVKHSYIKKQLGFKYD